MNKPQIVVVVGPTAVGKSDFAVEYAIKHNGEVISADSRQVYKGLDVGTGKITKKEMQGVPHHLLDVASPKTHFNVQKYAKLAHKAIGEIVNRDKLPIVCGGTGFYIDAIVRNIEYPNVKPDEKLRINLNKKDSKSLLEILEKLDPSFTKRLNNSDKNNKQRLVRYIEIAKALGKIPKAKTSKSPYKIKYIKLSLPKEKLIEKINKRLEKRLEQGMIREVENLHKRGLSWKRMEELGLEYRYVSRFLRKKISREELVEKLQTEIWHYAKRQILWFKKYPES